MDSPADSLRPVATSDSACRIPVSFNGMSTCALEAAFTVVIGLTVAHQDQTCARGPSRRAVRVDLQIDDGGIAP